MSTYRQQNVFEFLNFNLKGVEEARKRKSVRIRKEDGGVREIKARNNGDEKNQGGNEI